MSAPSPTAAPVVAIVGRPNVGKSSLFNAVVRRRIAIVHAEEGVTRDALMAPALWNDKAFTVVDTGGLALMDRARGSDAILAAAAEQVRAAIDDCSVAIQVVDLTAGVQPLDLEVARLLRSAGKPVLVAANKADCAGAEDALPEFAELAPRLFPVSAAHRIGLEPLLDAVAALLPAVPPGPDRLSVAVVGRPNAGKSSFINRLVGHDRLIVSDVAGTTRDSVRVPFDLPSPDGPPRHYWLVDTAGMRRATRVHGSVEKFSLFRAEEAIRTADIVVLVIDARTGPGDQEKKIAARIREAHRASVVLVNKWDLAQQGGLRQADYEAALRKELFFLDDIPVVFASALSGYNIRKAFAVIDSVAARLGERLPTGVLNRVLRDAFESSQPPVRGNRQLKFYYAAQTGSNPPRITLFVNDPTLSTPAHQAYLAARLRKAFSLWGVPVVVQYRSSHGDPDHKA
ncbi:MAG: ribosome biogenesis GTPase Der [Kiritimatiellae bacterium]|nr:ribosome biogenesis GTPase Der [Kiritimatiellia bacterium]